MHHHPRGNGSSNTVEGMALLGVVRMASLHCCLLDLSICFEIVRWRLLAVDLTSSLVDGSSVAGSRTANTDQDRRSSNTG